MLTEQHKQTIEHVCKTEKASSMVPLIHDFLLEDHKTGPLSTGECTKEEILHYFLDCAGVPTDLSLKQRLALYQILDN